MPTRLLASFDPRARTVIGVMGLFALASSLSGVFVNVYLWQVEHSLRSIAIYNMASWVAVLLITPLVGGLAKRRGAARPLQMGLFGEVLFYGVLLLLQERAGEHLLSLGVLKGAALAFFAIGANTLNYEVSTNADRDRFFSVTGLIGTACGLTAPVLAGALISWLGQSMGYRIIFGASFALLVAAALLCFQVKSATHPEPLALWPVLRRPDGNWRRVLVAHGLIGFREVYGFLMSLLIFSALGSEAKLGQWSMLVGLVGLGSYALLTRRITPGNRVRWLLVGALGVFGAAGVLSVSLAWWGLLLHSLLNALFMPLANTPFNSLTYSAMGDDGRRHRHEYIVAREIPLGVGRLLVGSLFLLVEPQLALLGPRALGLFVVLMGAMHLAAWAVLRPLESPGGEAVAP